MSHHRLQVRAGILFLVQRSAHIENLGVASQLNSLIHNLVIESTVAHRIIDWIDVGFFAFGADCGGKAVIESMLSRYGVHDGLVSVADIACVRRLAQRTIEAWDEEAGDIREEVIDVPIWIESLDPQAKSPLCEALTVAHRTLATWIEENHTNYPPIACVITDGSVDDGDPAGHAEALGQIATDDGTPMLVIHHFPAENTRSQIHYPALLHDPVFSVSLHGLSSRLPDPREMARRIYAKRYSYWSGDLPESIIGQPWQKGAKGYACNVLPNLHDFFGFQCRLYTDD